MYRNEIYIRQDTVTNPRACILMVHGLHDHSGRYDHVAEAFNEQQWNVIRYDHRGHGKSHGLRGYIPSFGYYTTDYGDILTYTRTSNARLPLFVVAHSMGGLIAVSHAINESRDNPPDGLVLTAALIKVNEDISPFLQKISGLISAILPKLATVRLDLNALSRDPSVAENAIADPLYYRGGVRARTGAEIMNETKDVEKRIGEFHLPVFLLHGGNDELTRPVASAHMYRHCRSEDKSMKIYPGAYHELLHEINRDEVIADVIGWMSSRVPNQ